MRRCMEIEKQLVAMEEDILVNPQYVQKIYEPQDEEGAPQSSGSSSHTASPFNVSSINVV